MNLTVDVDGVVEGGEGRQFPNDGDVVTLATQATHRIGAFVDRRVEAGGQYAEEVAAGAVVGCHLTDVDQADGGNAECPHESCRDVVAVARREPQSSGDVVAGSPGDNAQRHVTADQALEHGVHGAVAATCDHGTCARGYGLGRGTRGVGR